MRVAIALLAFLATASFAQDDNVLAMIHLDPNCEHEQREDVESSCIKFEREVFERVFESRSAFGMELALQGKPIFVLARVTDTEDIFAGELTSHEAKGSEKDPLTAANGVDQRLLFAHVEDVRADVEFPEQRGTTDLSSLLLTVDKDELGALTGFIDVLGQRIMFENERRVDANNNVYLQSIIAHHTGDDNCAPAEESEADDEDQVTTLKTTQPTVSTLPPIIGIPTINSTINTTLGLLDQMHPASLRHESAIALQSHNELRIGYFFECLSGNRLRSKDQTVWNAIRAGSVSQSFWLSSGRWTGPVNRAYCRNGAWSDATTACKARNRIRNWMKTSNGNNWRNNNFIDVGVWIRELTGNGGCANIVNFYQPNWTSSGANRVKAFCSDDPDVAISRFSIQHEIGHLMGFRHNRQADNSETNQNNHGGAWFSTVTDTCWPNVMSYNNACNAPGKTNQGRYQSFSSNYHFPSNNFDYHSSTYKTRCNNWSDHHRSLDCMAAYA